MYVRDVVKPCSFLTMAFTGTGKLDKSTALCAVEQVCVLDYIKFSGSLGLKGKMTE